MVRVPVREKYHGYLEMMFLHLVYHHSRPFWLPFPGVYQYPFETCPNYICIGSLEMHLEGGILVLEYIVVEISDNMAYIARIVSQNAQNAWA